MTATKTSAAVANRRAARWASYLPAWGRIESWVVEHRRRVTIGLAAVVLACGLVAVVAALLAESEHRLSTARAEAVVAGQRAVGTLLSYDYRTVSEDMPERRALLTDEFAGPYVDQLKSSTAPLLTRERVATLAYAKITGIMKADDDHHVTLLMFVDQISKSPAKSEPTFTGHRIRVEMVNSDGRWLVGQLAPI